MKELTKKILEAGLVDKTVAQLLERWHLLTPEEAALAQKPVAVVEALEKFVENLEELVEAARDGEETTDKPMRETRLDIEVVALHELWTGGCGYFTAAEDNMGRLLVHYRYGFKPGSLLYRDEDASVAAPYGGASPLYRVLQVETMYEKDRKHYTQLTVDKLDE